MDANCPRVEEYYPFDVERHVIIQLCNPENADALAPAWKALYSRCDDQLAIRQWFAWECIKAYRWDDDERQTPSQKSDELIAIALKADELRQMIEKNKYARDIADTIFKQLSGHNGFSMSEALLDLYTGTLRESEAPTESRQPGRRHAHEIIFVRRLTAAMRERFNQPLASVVAKAASVIFQEKILKKFVENNT